MIFEICRFCNKKFKKSRYNRVFCSSQCQIYKRNRYVEKGSGTCICGQKFKKKRLRQKFCSQKCMKNSSARKNYKKNLAKIIKKLGGYKKYLLWRMERAWRCKYQKMERSILNSIKPIGS